MSATLVKTKEELLLFMNDFNDSGYLQIGMEGLTYLIDNFVEIHEKLDGRYIYIEDGLSRMILCLVDFNYVFYKKNTNKTAKLLIGKLSETVAKKIKTIGNDTYLILSCLILSEKDWDVCFTKCLKILKKLYREFHFIICQSRKIDFELNCTKYFLHKINSLYLYHINSEIEMQNVSFSYDEKEHIYLALPDSADIEVLFNQSNFPILKSTLDNYKYSPDNPFVFLREEFSKCDIKIIKITYDQLLIYQRYLNVFNLKEHLEVFDGEDFESSLTYNILVYTIGNITDQVTIWNNRLKVMIENRQNEWSLIPDVILMYPVCIGDIEKIKNNVSEYDSDINTYMHYLDIRLQCETGIPYGHDGADMMARFKERVSRYYLGPVKFRITEEMIMDILDKEDVPVGADIYMNIIVAVDEESNVGVLYVVSLSSPFLLSHLLDNVVRNQLMVVDKDGMRNLYEYILEKWELQISGTPKSYVTIPRSKESLEPQQLAALLMSETIYEEGEDFSQVIDQEIVKLANDQYGMGQYDIAYVGATLNAFIQFHPSYRGSKHLRLFWNAVTAFYIELILFEESAVTRFNRELVKLMSEANEDSPERFLEKNRDITNEYLSSVEFWDVQLNYPSSQRSIRMIREAFNESQLMARMERYQNQVKNIFAINRELIDRNAEKEEKKSTDDMNFILFVLTIVSTISAIYQIVDYIMNYTITNPIENIFPIIMNVIIIIGMLLIYFRRRKNK